MVARKAAMRVYVVFILMVIVGRRCSRSGRNARVRVDIDDVIVILRMELNGLKWMMLNDVQTLGAILSLYFRRPDLSSHCEGGIHACGYALPSPPEGRRRCTPLFRDGRGVDTSYAEYLPCVCKFDDIEAVVMVAFA